MSFLESVKKNRTRDFVPERGNPDFRPLCGEREWQAFSFLCPVSTYFSTLAGVTIQLQSMCDGTQHAMKRERPTTNRAKERNMTGITLSDKNKAERMRERTLVKTY